MKTKIFDFREKINEEDLEYCADCLKAGNIGIFPTETVYGIGANALDKKAASLIFKAKNRAIDNPLIIHISNFNMLKDLVEEPNEIEKKLIDAFFPGPFTLILKGKKTIPKEVNAGLKTVGIRMPNNEIAHKLIECTNIPICAPSANLSSKPSGTRLEDIIEEFDGKVSFMINGGLTKIGLESTVCEVIEGISTILRPGKITQEDIAKVVGCCKLDDNLFKEVTNTIPRSPGMKYKHYAPKKEAILIYSEDEEKLIQEIKNNMKENTIIIGCEEHKKLFKENTYLSYGSKNNLDEITRQIFTLLRLADKKEGKDIIIEGVKKEGLGLAIMNRLIRSVSFNYIEK